MLNELGKIELTKVLVRGFGKYTFTESELDSDFWSSLLLAGGDFFRNENGLMDLDFFWSEDIKQWIIADKEKWIKKNKAKVF